jgi:molybdenum cofactor cytidylyltransferase
VTTVAVILLAAGGSSRLGFPKQLLPFEGLPLVRRAALTALASRADRVAVVVGAHAADVAHALDGAAVEIVRHAAWTGGQASSLRAALAHVTSVGPVVDGVIVMLCDQPRVTAHLLDALIDRCQLGGACLAATAYGADGRPPVLGAPALFDRAFFAELNRLTGDEGAKSIIQRHRTEVAAVSFPDAAADIDTVADYVAALRSPPPK